MITLQQDLLQAALNAVTRVSVKNSLQSAFALVQLNVTTDGILHLSCFNGETAARATVNVDCNEDLAVCVDAATLKAVVETLAGQVRLHLEDTALVIEGAATRTSLHIAEEALPVLDQNDLHPLATFTGTTFRSLLRALPFASTDESRAILQVVHLMLEKTQATALAADGYTAGQVTEPIEGPQEDVSISLPVSSMRLLSSLIEERDTVRMGMHGASRLLFQISNAESSKNLMLATVTVDGNFPAAQIQTLIAELGLRGPVTIMDGGNRYRPYQVAMLLRRRTVDVSTAANRLFSQRAFTCYEMNTLLCSTPSLNQPYVILDLLNTFYDDHVPLLKRVGC